MVAPNVLCGQVRDDWGGVDKNKIGEEFGVFASEKIAAGELICVWGGRVVTMAEWAAMIAVQPELDLSCVSVHEGFSLIAFTEPGQDDVERMNHSCDANAGVKGQIVLLARRDIQSGEEITFNYETTDVEFPPFQCRCGSPHCRGIIDGSGWKDREHQERNRGWFSWYLQERIDKLGR